MCCRPLETRGSSLPAVKSSVESFDILAAPTESSCVSIEPSAGDAFLARMEDVNAPDSWDGGLSFASMASDLAAVC